MCAQGRRGDRNREVSMVTRTAGVKRKGLVAVVLCWCTLLTFSAPLSFPRSLSFSSFSHRLTSPSECVLFFLLFITLSRNLIDVISLFLARCHAHLIDALSQPFAFHLWVPGVQYKQDNDRWNMNLHVSVLEVMEPLHFFCLLTFSPFSFTFLSSFVSHVSGL